MGSSPKRHSQAKLEGMVLINTISHPASDAKLLEAAIAFANGGELTIELTGGRRIPRSADRLELTRWFASACESRRLGVFFEFMNVANQLARGIKLAYLVSVLAGKAGGVRLEVFRNFKTARAVFAFAAVLALDPEHPVGSRLSRCQWRDCRRFYLVKLPDRKGGKVNTTACCPKHGELYHNSKERRFGAKATESLEITAEEEARMQRTLRDVIKRRAHNRR